jgi:hypothetical protein
MRVAIRPISRTGADAAPLDEIRARLEQRLLAAHESWELEKRRLEEAMARAEEKEREFREAAEDVRRRLEAIDLVAAMASDLEERPTPAELPEPAAPEQPRLIEEKPRTDLSVQATSRPLFTQEVRAGLFSILR